MSEISLQPSPLSKGKILVIDDEEPILESLKILLESEKYEVVTAPTGTTGLDKFTVASFDLVLLDLMLPDISGLEILKKIRSHDLHTPIVVLTAYGSIETAVSAIKLGATDFCTKPWNNEKLVLEIDRSIQQQRLKHENARLKSILRSRFSFSNIIGKSEAMQRVFDLVGQAAPSRATVLINGNTGTGKELIAKAIHANSSRSSQPFVTVNTSSIPVNLIGSALFGNPGRNSTDVEQTRKGSFDVANGGTVFLDEIETLSSDVQTNLLRVLQEREFVPVDSEKAVQIDVRIIVATSSNLEKLVHKGIFRKDLYYRLNVIQIDLPPLRKRAEDIPLLVEFFLNKYCQENERFLDSTGHSLLHFAPAAMRFLLNHNWPGNVRELENVIERVTVLTTEPEIGAELLPESILGPESTEIMDVPSITIESAAGASLFEMVEEFERRVILNELEKSRWIQTEAAKRLHVALSTLNQKIQRLQIDIKRYREPNQQPSQN